jgi:hypothetical protein
MIQGSSGWNSKVEPISHISFQGHCEPKMKTSVTGAGMRADNDRDLTSSLRFLEVFFPAQAKCVTAILFSQAHWRSSPVDPD